MRAVEYHTVENVSKHIRGKAGNDHPYKPLEYQSRMRVVSVRKNNAHEDDHKYAEGKAREIGYREKELR